MCVQGPEGVNEPYICCQVRQEPEVMPSSSDEPDNKEEDAASCVRKGNFGVYCEYPHCTTVVSEISTTTTHPKPATRVTMGEKNLSLCNSIVEQFVLPTSPPPHEPRISGLALNPLCYRSTSQRKL